ncbi:small ribosomal subunit protein mS25-like [Dysidea avara]|uniref:small ribosomal subunit protein mS25-like n=1 Tax=Dysidea avara TaxID=196820 RepID=UPI00331EA5E8
MAAQARNVSYAYRRTMEFLSSGKIHLRRNVMAIHIKYTTHIDSSAGTRWFVAEEVPKLQYKNPRVQILISKNESPSPSIDIYHRRGNIVRIDTDNKSSDGIISRLAAVAAKDEKEVQKEKAKNAVNTANFGHLSAKFGGHFCICEIPGQAPCPGKVTVKRPVHEWHNKDS